MRVRWIFLVSSKIRFHVFAIRLLRLCGQVEVSLLLGLRLLPRQGFQVLHQVILFPTAKPETETCVIVVHNVEKSGESAVMEETAFRVGPKSI
jgi:hypothetical protein